MAILDATPAGPNANSYLTLAEAADYYTRRTPLDGWDNADDQALLLMMATRTLDKLLMPGVKELYVKNGEKYYRVRPAWTGVATTTTQRLAWPRTGMLDQNGNAIGTMVIPADLKDAVAEFAGQLGGQDRTLDNDLVMQGLSSLKAGSVALGFDGSAVVQVVPDAVYNLLVASWYTNESYEQAVPPLFDIFTQDDL